MKNILLSFILATITSSLSYAVCPNVSTYQGKVDSYLKRITTYMNTRSPSFLTINSLNYHKMNLQGMMNKYRIDTSNNINICNNTAWSMNSSMQALDKILN